MPLTGRRLMATGACVRLAYGLGALLAPRAVAGRLAAEEHGSVMNLRGFGGQHVAVGLFTLLSSRSRTGARPALLLNAGIEVCDAVAGALEVREQGWQDAIAAGGVALPFVGLTTWLTALRTLGR